MICQHCGARAAMVHFEEIGVEGRRHLWLCEICAASHRSARYRPGDLPPDDPGPVPPPSAADEHPEFISFLDQRFAPDLETDPEEEPGACPACGFELTELGAVHRLGCPHCYEHFRDRLRPMLVRIHHHSSHLGRVPRHSGAQRSLSGEIARHRLALEKAIVAEQYEEAARLRDRIARLEKREQGAPDDSADGAAGEEGEQRS